jgi:hypothetical protein
MQKTDSSPASNRIIAGSPDSEGRGRRIDPKRLVMEGNQVPILPRKKTRRKILPGNKN